MKKIILQGIVVVFSFLVMWGILNEINWMKLLRVDRLTSGTEEKLGELFWDTFRKTGKEITDTLIVQSVDSIVIKICDHNDIDPSTIRPHILQKDEVNAFALPGGHLIILSGLMKNSDNAEELSGVIAHETAHIRSDHVMKKLIREVGLSVLVSMTTGNSGSTVITETAKLLSSSAFDRRMEKEADLKAIEYLTNAAIDPEPFADFMYKLSEQEGDAAQYLSWISTHPDSKERAAYITDHIRGRNIVYEPALSPETWNNILEKLNED